MHGSVLGGTANWFTKCYPWYTGAGDNVIIVGKITEMIFVCTIKRVVGYHPEVHIQRSQTMSRSMIVTARIISCIKFPVPYTSFWFLVFYCLVPEYFSLSNASTVYVTFSLFNRYLGCGLVFPSAVKGLKVLDFGSGSGRDCFRMSQLVGMEGLVSGVDKVKEECYVLKK